MKNSILGAGIMALISLASCNRTSDSVSTDSTTSAASVAKSAATVTTSVNAVQTDVVQANYQGFYGITSGTAKPGDMDSSYLGCLKGATVTKTTTNGVTTITIDYGTGIADDHGHTKAGQVVVVTSGSIKTKDLNTKVTFTNFSIDGNVQNGTLTFTVSLDSNGNPVMTRTEDIAITKADGSGTVTRKGTFTRTMTAGYATPKDVSDDVWTETGNATMTDSTGTYSVTITNAITFPMACGNPVSGTIVYDKNGAKYTLDFGSSTCDTSATLTLPDGTVTTITLEMPRKKK